MAEHASTGYRLVREVLIRSMATEGQTPAEIAATFGITATYVRRIITTPPKRKKALTPQERKIGSVAAKRRAELVAAGYGFLFQ